MKVTSKALLYRVQFPSNSKECINKKAGFKPAFLFTPVVIRLFLKAQQFQHALLSLLGGK